eukprot:6477199-Lingulodinium_polyedra.AAC.1
MSARVAPHWNTKELQDTIKPNQTERLSAWMSNLAGGSLRKLLRRLRCKESVEMLSMPTRVMNDPTI